ncbi:MAG: carboxypeptidase regulatory-like domain-containing protein [Candidatus Cloacimonetes bacterium]|nr:carboxypeptidase regulatory-like domain-containing protein [Candidatus Cloacimonadota bacterium]
MRRRMKMIVFFLLMSLMLTAGSITGNIAVTGVDSVEFSVLLMHHPYPSGIDSSLVINSGDNYCFDEVAFGTYLVYVMTYSPHYLPKFYDGAIEPDDAVQIVINGSNPDVTGIDFLLEYLPEGIGCEVSGQVLATDNEPVEGLEVRLYGTPNCSWFQYIVETGADGIFIIPDIIPGDYFLWLEYLEGYQHYFWEDAHNLMNADIITLEAGDVMSGLELQLVPLPSQTISGTVRETDGGNEFPVSGALVSGYAMNCWGEGEYFQTITDEYGHYNATVTHGMYWLYTTSQGYFDQYWEGAGSFDDATPLHINQDLTDIDFVLTSIEDPADNSISGYISAEGEEPGFPCLVIVIASDEDDDWSEVTESESSGYYYIDEIPAGEYYVVMMTSATPPVYYPEGYDWENAEIVYIEGDVTGIDFEIENMTQNGVIIVEGNITSSGRDPVAGVSVIFINEQGFPVSYGISNSEGDYSAVSIETGNYSVLASKAFYESENVELSITNNSSLDFIITQSVTAEDDDSLPEVNSNIRCYPNPFLLSNSRSNLSIQLYPQTAGATRISLYNLRGQLVENIFTGWMEAEPQTISWSAGTGSRDIPSGVYLISMEQSGTVQSAQKLLLIK